jgi:hypothetical protein
MFEQHQKPHQQSQESKHLLQLTPCLPIQRNSVKNKFSTNQAADKKV